MNLQVSDGWVKTDSSEIVDRLKNGEKLLATLSDLLGTYAIAVYWKGYRNIDFKDEDFKEFLQLGEWYEQEI